MVSGRGGACFQTIPHRSELALRTGTKGNKGYDGSVIGMTVKINKESECNGAKLVLWIRISFKADPDLVPDPVLMPKNLNILQLKQNFLIKYCIFIICSRPV